MQHGLCQSLHNLSAILLHPVAGINLASVSAVVHATMPRSLEEYVQQVRLSLGGGWLVVRWFGAIGWRWQLQETDVLCSVRMKGGADGVSG